MPSSPERSVACISVAFLLTMSIIVNNNIRLNNLEVTNYTLVNNVSFHRSISQQTSLESLKLRADPEESFHDDIDKLVSSISTLKNLKILNLLSTSDYFKTSDIARLVSALPSLEEFWFGKSVCLSSATPLYANHNFSSMPNTSIITRKGYHTSSWTS
jgi:hypothetical protein